MSYWSDDELMLVKNLPAAFWGAHEANVSKDAIDELRAARVTIAAITRDLAAARQERAALEVVKEIVNSNHVVSPYILERARQALARPAAQS